MRSNFRPFFDACASLVALFGGILCALASIIDWYDRISFRRHAEFLRKIIPWKMGRSAALFPFAIAFIGISCENGVLLTITCVVSLAVAEPYSVSLHRDSFVAAFEPHSIQMEWKILNKNSERESDRRLHFIIRTHLLYTAGLLAGVFLVSFGGDAVGYILLPFVMKYLAGAWKDYEAYSHWSMHVNIFATAGSTNTSHTVWHSLIELVLSPSIGSIPWLYSTEHTRLHHKYNGGRGDVSCPVWYSRLSPSAFAIFVLRTLFTLGSAAPVLNARECTSGDKARILLSVVLFWSVVLLATFDVPILSIWLIIGLVYRSVNHAKAQFIWHGFDTRYADRNPLHTTVQWAPSAVSLHSTIQGNSEWGYLDNYHLLHHLHPRAHFTSYPALLEDDADRILAAGSIVIDVDFYSRFFSCLMSVNLASVHENILSPSLSANELIMRLSAPDDRRVPRWDPSARHAVVVDSILGVMVSTSWVSPKARSSRLDYREDVF